MLPPPLRELSLLSLLPPPPSLPPPLLVPPLPPPMSRDGFVGVSESFGVVGCVLLSNGPRGAKSKQGVPVRGRLCQQGVLVMWYQPFNIAAPD